MKPNQNPLTIPARQIREKGYRLEVQVEPQLLDLSYDFFAFDNPVAVNLVATSVGKEFLVQGSLNALIEGECARCLKPVPLKLELDQCTFLIKDLGQDYIDVGPDIRDELLLALPSRVLCDTEEEAPTIIRYKGKSSTEDTKSHNPFQDL